MKKYLFISFILLMTGTGYLFSQTNNDSLICTYFYLESGDIYVGKIITKTETEWNINELRLGEIRLGHDEVTEVVPLYRDDRVQLRLADNTRYTGRLQSIENDEYILRSEAAGEVRIPMANVSELMVVGDKLAVTRNPNATRYFFAPSAIPLEKGTGYYQNAYILANSVNYGVTNNFSVGGGVGIPIFFFVTPKVGFKVAKNFYLAGGAIAATTFIGDNVTIAIPFAAATYGNAENNATIAAGYGLFWMSGDFEQSRYPIVTVNGMLKLSNRLHLVTENWVISFVRTYEYDNGYFDAFGNYVPVITETKKLETYVASALGLRIKVGEKATFDVAPVYLHVGSNLVLPYLDFVYKF